jgi:hypothetical protein
MKISSSVSVMALLFGIGAFMHPAAVKASLPPGYCQNLYAACQHGDQNACALYKSVCSARSPGSLVIGAPTSKSNSRSDAALRESGQAILLAM